jgi:hypothetical protein
MADENLDPNLLAGARPELAPTAPDFAPEQTVTNPRRHGGWAASVRRGWQLNGLTGHFERGWAQDTSTPRAGRGRWGPLRARKRTGPRSGA